MQPRILVVGNGAREHAILWKLAQSKHRPKLFATPGNGGTSAIAENIVLSFEYPLLLTDFAIRNHFDLVVIGPENALATGLADKLREKNIPVFGPNSKAARIETSKIYGQKLMDAAGIHYPETHTFFKPEQALAYICSSECKFPCVIKKDGLHNAEGVYICNNVSEAEGAIKEIRPGDIFQIQEFVYGQELSAHAIVNGEIFLQFPHSRDYKKLRDGDQGTNTGGMGAYAPVSHISSDIEQIIREEVIRKILTALTRDTNPFSGCRYPGLIITPDGKLSVLEYNARFGDPETSAYMRLLKSDFVDLLLATETNKLSE